MRFGTAKDALRPFRWVLVPLFPVIWLFKRPSRILWLLLILFIGAFPVWVLSFGSLMGVPLMVGLTMLFIWWYPRRGRRRVIPELGEKPVEPQGVARYENWPS